MISQRVSQVCNVFWPQKIILNIQPQRTEVFFGQTLFETQLSFEPFPFLLALLEQIDGSCGLESFSAHFNCRDAEGIEEPALSSLDVLDLRCFDEKLFFIWILFQKFPVNSCARVSKEKYKTERLSILTLCKLQVLLYLFLHFSYVKGIELMNLVPLALFFLIFLKMFFIKYTLLYSPEIFLEVFHSFLIIPPNLLHCIIDLAKYLAK